MIEKIILLVYTHNKRGDNVLNLKRYEMILNILNKKDVVKLQKIVDKLGISESTARRDLNYLEEKGLLERIHGGARLPSGNLEEDFQSKNVQNQSEKKRIGDLAAKEIEDGELIFLDAGTTTETLIPYLKDRDITVVTNGTTHLSTLGKYSVKTYIIEGMIKHKTGAIVGSEAIESLLKYNFDRAFLGTNGVHIEKGYTTPDAEEARIKKRVIKNSKRTYIMADSNKFSRISSVTFGGIEECTIITDKEIDKKYKEITLVKEGK